MLRSHSGLLNERASGRPAQHTKQALFSALVPKYPLLYSTLCEGCVLGLYKQLTLVSNRHMLKNKGNTKAIYQSKGV